MRLWPGLSKIVIQRKNVNMALDLPLPKLERCSRDSIEVLSDETLFEACGVRVAFTGRDGGVSEGSFASLNVADWVGDDIGSVMENRLRIARMIGAESAPVVIPTQVHGTEILRVGSDEPGRLTAHHASGGSVELKEGNRERLPLEADAVLVESAGVASLMMSADCLLFSVVSPSGRFVTGHAGWRGAVAHVARKAVEALSAFDDCASSGYNAYIGPHIGVGCFEVGEDVSQKFIVGFGSEVVTPSGNVDLTKAVTCDLVAAGLDASRVADARVCTKCNPDGFFSYRAAHGDRRI